jgi:hypothetical protein
MFKPDAKILARPGTTRQQHHQRALPKTPQRCSGNQAVNSMGVQKNLRSKGWPALLIISLALPSAPAGLA